MVLSAVGLSESGGLEPNPGRMFNQAAVVRRHGGVDAFGASDGVCAATETG